MVRKLKVDAIKNGTVIDHIPGGKSLQVADLLGLNTSSHEVMIGINLSSKKLGKKDIIKVENRELSKNEVNSIALIAPSASIIIIKNYKVGEKFQVETPHVIENLIVCPNPNCITSLEKVNTKFKVSVEPLEVRCQYCEKKYKVDEIKIKI